MGITEKQILEALGKVQEPELHKDLVTLNMIKDIQIDGGNIRFTVVLTTPACPLKAQIQRESEEALMRIPGVEKIDLQFTSQVTSGIRPDKAKMAQGIKNIIAVSSGKGGVGKSTVAVNVSVALAQTGAKVGLLDVDVHGPNVPIMMGIKGRPEMVDNKLVPLENYGVKIMSMGFLVDENAPVIWRGPMFHGIIKQFMEQVAWGELDYLILDLPPGTGDAQLSVCQLIPVTGAVIVTTPQDVALGDAKKGLAMFQKVHVPVLGIVENMSFYVCSHCGERTEIFSHGGGRKAAEKLEVPFLGAIPLVVAVRIGGDEGNPIVVSDPDSSAAKVIREVTGALAAKISLMNASARVQIPILGQA